MPRRRQNPKTDTMEGQIMNMKDCYLAFGGDYEGVLARFRGEERIRQFLLKFLEDPCFNELCQPLAKQDLEEAFRAAHTLKGVCQNLGFSRLYESSSRLTELLRKHQYPDSDELLDQVKRDYWETVDAIRKGRDEAEL